MKLKAFAWSVLMTALLATSGAVLSGCQGYQLPPEGIVDIETSRPAQAWDPVDDTAEHSYRGLSQ